MKALWNLPAFRVGLMLAVFAVVATTLVAFTEESTREQIIENERQALLEACQVLDQTASKGVIHKNQAARRKSRMNARLKAKATA